VVVHKCLGILATAFQTAETVHHIVIPRVKLGAISVGVAGFPLALLRLRYVHVVGRAEQLRLSARIDLEIEQRELAARLESGVVHQQ
jgi:hypothetical protein